MRLEGLPNKVMASEYRTALPDEKELAAEIERTQALLQDRKRIALTSPVVEEGRLENLGKGRDAKWMRKMKRRNNNVNVGINVAITQWMRSGAYRGSSRRRL